MNIFRLKSGIFSLTFTLAAGLFLVCPVAEAGSEENVLLITIDTLRPDRLSCYGPKYVKTPVIDALASRGALYEFAFAHTSITLASHTNILLGTTPLYHGVSENSKTRVPDAFLTLAEHLKSSGYATGAFIGAFPLDSRFGLTRGFDVYDDHYPSHSLYESSYTERKAEQVIAPAMDWLAKQTGKWFCWIHLWDPHAPYLPPEPLQKRPVFGGSGLRGRAARDPLRGAPKKRIDG
jgi:arylsulfatase A-like enzyme